MVPLTASRSPLPRSFWLLAAVVLLSRCGALIQPMLTYWLTGPLGAPLTAAAWVAAAWGAGSTLGSLIGGVTADRFGRRRSLLISGFGASCAVYVLGRASDAAVAARVAFVVALLTDMGRPAVFAMVADVVPPEDRARAYAWMYVAVNLAFAVTPAIAGRLAGYGYDVVFAVSVGVLLAYTAVVAVALPETRPAAGPGRAGVGFGVALGDRVFLAFVGLCVLSTLVAMQGMVPLSAWMKSQGHGEASYGGVMALNGALIVVCQPTVTRLVGRRDAARVFALGAALQGVGFAMHGAGATIGWHRVALTVWTGGEMLLAPVMSAVVAALAPAEARGRYQGLMAMSWGVAGGAAPLLGAEVMTRASAGALWGGCAVLGVVCALGSLALGPALRRRMASDAG